MKINELQAPSDEFLSNEDVNTIIDIAINNRWEKPMSVDEFLNRYNVQENIDNDKK